MGAAGVSRHCVKAEDLSYFILLMNSAACRTQIPAEFGLCCARDQAAPGAAASSAEAELADLLKETTPAPVLPSSPADGHRAAATWSVSKVLGNARLFLFQHLATGSTQCLVVES